MLIFIIALARRSVKRIRLFYQPLLTDNQTLSVSLIEVVAFMATVIGFLLGRKAGHLIGRRAEAIGGMVLIGIGIKILVEHIL